MSKRPADWSKTFKSGLMLAVEERYGDGNQRLFVADMVKKMLVSRQAVYRWLNKGHINAINLDALADHFGVDYGDLRAYGTFVKKGAGSTPSQPADLLRAVAGYSVEGLPPADEVAARWHRLPPAIQAFLLHQMRAYEELISANPALAGLLFRPPNHEYPQFERSLEQWQENRRR